MIQALNTTNGIVTSFNGTVNLTGSTGPTNSVAIAPGISGNFTQGVWTGAVTVTSIASNLVLRADDGAGHSGLSNPFQVVAPGQPPMIMTQPASLSVRTGTNVTFQGSATGSAPLSYGWRKNGSSLVDGGKISGSATSSLTISNIANKDGGQYSVLVTNAYGSVLSSNAALTILKGKATAALAFDPVTGAAIAVTVPEPPTLSVESRSSGLLILWPADPAWVLESSSDLSGESWTPVTDAPTQAGDQYTVPVQTSEPFRFYRLRYSPQ